MKEQLAKAILGGSLVVLAAVLLGFAPARYARDVQAQVKLLRTPNAGLQPQAVLDERGVLHLIYFVGEAANGDVFYVRREAGRAEFSAPLRVNSQPGSAIATGTIRGAQIALGKNGRVHVAWNGSNNALPRGPENSAPMLYARLNDARTAFEPQRNVMQFSGGLDGGGTVAADQAGNVYVAWHGRGEQKGEAHRRVWLALSRDEGQTFAREKAAFNEATGACGCCGMRAFVEPRGRLFMLYRVATAMTERGMFLLTSTDRGKSFRGAALDHWELTTCPMSSETMFYAGGKTLAAWENDGQVFFSAVSAPTAPAPIAAPGASGKRKHPAVAVNARGETLLVWTEGTGWKKGGSLAWQLFDQQNKPVGALGTAPDVPVWSLPTAVAERDGSFTVIY